MKKLWTGSMFLILVLSLHGQSLNFEELTSKEIRELAKANVTVIVPIAQIENHGLYLPVATDLYLTREICRKAAEKNGKSIVAPAIQLGNCSDYTAWPGYIVVRNQTFLDIVEDYLSSLKQQGFQNVVFCLMHGGHNFNSIDIAVSERNRELGMKVQIVSMNVLMSPIWKEISELLLKGKIDPELTMMMALKPNLIKDEKSAGKMAQPQLPSFMGLGRYYDPEYTLDKIAPDGMVAYSEKATAAIGEKLMDMLSSGLAERVLKRLTD